MMKELVNNSIQLLRVVILPLLALPLFAQSYNPDLLQCTLSVEKDTFLVDEPIYVEFKETNIGNVDVLTQKLTNDACPYFFTTALKSSDGRLIPYHGLMPFLDPGALPFEYVLEPGESQYSVFLMTSDYGVKDTRNEAFWPYYLPPGRYSFQLTHYTNARHLYEKTQAKLSNRAIEIDKMPVVSNEIVFYIIEPQTAEQEKERQAYIKCRNRDYRYPFDLIIALENYFENYKNSNLFYKYELLSTMKATRTNINFSKEETLNQVKNSYAAFYFKSASKKDYGFQDDKREFTPQIEIDKQIAAKYPDTQLAKYSFANVRALEQMRAKFLKEGKEE